MKVTAYKTPLVTAKDDLYHIIADAIPYMPERSVVVIASKIVSTCENRFVKKVTGKPSEKHELVRKEAEFYAEPHSSKYDLMLTVHRNWMFVNAGIDESNADNQYILWPEDPQASVNKIWAFLREHYNVKEVGVTMSDSTSIPLNWGVMGHAIAHCGFEQLKSYIGKPDLHGRTMRMEQVNISQGLTAAAVLEMGEGDESTPLAVVRDIKDIVFQDHPPTQEELDNLHVDIEDDVFAPLLTKAEWKKGEKNPRSPR